MDIINELDLLVRQRRQLMQARMRLENQLSALTRAAEETAGSRAADAARGISPVLAAHLDALLKQQKPFDKAITKLAGQLPIAEWVKSTPGVGLLSVGLIIGEAGNLSNYTGPAKVWKRFGLAVIDGERQRKVKDVEEALRHGYSPRRRSLLHVIGTAFMRLRRSPYREVYDQRKAYELTRVEKGHAHMRALRFAEKRLLLDLWKAWNDATAKKEAA